MKNLPLQLIASGFLLAAGTSHAGHDTGAAMTASVSDLAGLTLEQLANIQVTSVSRREERLADAAGSVFVISSEDIRRSGAVNLPEVLRLAPNLHVARADANQYAISARGFNSTTANKMLVLVDGRTVYSPLFSGVFWDAQDVMLEDVERIEVLSGPGGTLWGSNAVNGFINIITKTAQATQGGLVSLGVGTRDRAHALRWGGSLGGDGFYRVYGKHSSRDNTVNPAGASKQDGSGKTQAGFRADWGLGADKVTLQGDAYQSDIDQATPNGDRHLEGANILGRYVRELGPSSGLRLQAYVDHTLRRQPGSVIDRLDTLDVDIQHNFQPTPSQRVLWGAGYRVQDDRVDNISAGLAFLPAQKNLKLANVFAQDEIALAPGLDFTLGLKLEHNDYTGLEYLPNARLAWRPAAGHLVWGGVSRTLRIPSRIDRELFAPATPPYTALAGGANFRSEVADVFEFGYRSQATPALAYSATLFHHRFDRQRSVEPTAAGPVISNMIDGTTSGVEAWGTYRASSSWRLKAGMFWQRQKLQLKAGSASIGGVTNLGNDPGHQWSVGSSWDLAPAVELDVTARHTGALPNPTLASYTALDMRVGWRPRAGMDVSVTLQNLAGARHYEWGSPASRAQIERAAFVKLAWKL